MSKTNEISVATSEDFANKIRENFGSIVKSDIAVHEEPLLSNVRVVSADVFHRMVQKLVDESNPIQFDKPHGNSKEVKESKKPKSKL